MRFTQILRLCEKTTSTRSLKEILSKMDGNQLALWLSKPKSFTLKQYNENLINSRLDDIKKANEFQRNDFLKYGAELHAAHFAASIHGKFRLEGSKRWIKKKSEEEDLNEKLPETKNTQLKIEGLDLSESLIQYVGLENIEQCSSIKTLIARKAPFVNDWFLARVSYAFSGSLEYLDISDNDDITDHGLLNLYKLKNLKRLVVKNVKPCENIEYICALLEDYLPELDIEGVDFKSDKAIERIQKRIEKESKQFAQKLQTFDKKYKDYIKQLESRVLIDIPLIESNK